MDLFIARQPGTQTTRKAVLLDACEATGIQPRPNWIHPSPREFMAEFQLFAEASGYSVGDPLPHPLVPGAKTTYTTAKSWPVTDKHTGKMVVITWDSLTGEIHGQVRGSVWQPLADSMPEVIAAAYQNAVVIHNNVIDQIALSFMLSVPSAPFVSSGLQGKQRNSLWLALSAEYQDTAKIFFQAIGRPLLDGMIIGNGDIGPSPVTRQRIVASCERGCKRLARGSGWTKVCKGSHQELLDLIG